MPLPRTCTLLLPLVVAGIASSALAADLQITPAVQSHIVLDALSDTHCPWQCATFPPRCPYPPCADSIVCCDTFGAIVGHLETRPVTADYTFIDGDLGLTSDCILNPWARDRFYGYYDRIPGAKSLGMGNHEADATADSSGTAYWWVDPGNHYAPANWWEPLFGCDSTTAVADCRRWYSVYVGEPPRVAWIALSNSSDEKLGDATLYVWTATPNDGLNHAASPQRQWLNAEIDALPPTVEVVFVAGHRAYYGVEDFPPRPNIELSGQWSPADPETLRTGAVSLLRDLESIYDRKPNVKRVFMISGDQHCFSQTVPIRLNQRDDERGVIYVVLGISGAGNQRGRVFPKLAAIPPNTLVHSFNDRWGSTRFELEPERVTMTVREAYTDSLLHQANWPLITHNPTAVAAPAASPVPLVRVWPNPTRNGAVEVEFRPPDDRLWDPVDEIAVYDVAGRRVRRFQEGRWSNGTWYRDWDLRDEEGKRVAAGSYFVQVRQRGEAVALARVTVRD
jgi:hypothetical protein